MRWYQHPFSIGSIFSVRLNLRKPVARLFRASPKDAKHNRFFCDRGAFFYFGGWGSSREREWWQVLGILSESFPSWACRRSLQGKSRVLDIMADEIRHPIHQNLFYLIFSEERFLSVFCHLWWRFFSASDCFCHKATNEQEATDLRPWPPVIVIVVKRIVFVRRFPSLELVVSELALSLSKGIHTLLNLF